MPAVLSGSSETHEAHALSQVEATTGHPFTPDVAVMHDPLYIAPETVVVSGRRFVASDKLTKRHANVRDG